MGDRIELRSQQQAKTRAELSKGYKKEPWPKPNYNDNHKLSEFKSKAKATALR